MNPEVLLVERVEEFRQLAAQFLAIEWPGVAVDEWDPRARGEIPGFFPLGKYDALLLDYEPGLGNGLEWLVRLVKREDCPPVVFVTDSEDENITHSAMQRGAFDYLRKRGLSRTRLVEVIRAAAAERAARNSTRPAQRPELARYVGILDAVKLKHSMDVPAQKSQEVVINGYRMLNKIGSGGMATVYLAERTADGLRLVMKIMNARLTERNEFLKRFIQEYGLVSRIDCPQVVRIYDQGVTDRHLYIAMEHFGGGDLRARIREGLSPVEALDILRNVALALQAVHAHGIVHRDLKPDNVMFRVDGSLAIVDFGIATKNLGAVDVTVLGDVLGTPHYLSPEQARARPLDGRSDLYSLGIVFFEMLTGRRPFRAKDAAGLAHKHVNEPLPRLPPDLACYQELVDCLTAKRREDRFPGARELLAYMEANAATLCTGAEVLTELDAEHAGAFNLDVGPENSRAPRSGRNTPAKHSGSRSNPGSSRSASHRRLNATDSVLNVSAMLTRLGNDAEQAGDIAQTFTRTVQPLLTLVAEALNDRNLQFVYQAARVLQDAMAAVEAPEAMNAALALEQHASERDIGATAAAFVATHRLTRRLMIELRRMARGEL